MYRFLHEVVQCVMHLILHRLCTAVALNKVFLILLTVLYSVRPLYVGLRGGESSYSVARLRNTGVQAIKLYVVRTNSALK